VNSFEILREQVVWNLVSRLSKRVTPPGSRRRILSNEPFMHRSLLRDVRFATAGQEQLMMGSLTERNGFTN